MEAVNAEPVCLCAVVDASVLAHVRSPADSYVIHVYSPCIRAWLRKGLFPIVFNELQLKSFHFADTCVTLARVLEASSTPFRPPRIPFVFNGLRAHRSSTA
jgi:hypothetical protein